MGKTGFARTALALALGCSMAAAAPAIAEDHDGAPKHIFYIMMENHGTGEILGNTTDAPFINSLLASSGVATNYFGVTHPSLPNYLAAVSGDFQGIWDDCKAGVACAPQEFVPGVGDATDSGTGIPLLTQAQIASATAKNHMFSGQNLIDQLEARGLSWKAYMQSMPASNFTGVEYSPTYSDGGYVKLYAQKHNPFLYFSDIVNNPARLANIVPTVRAYADLHPASGKGSDVPAFVWVSPDQCHDMHGISPGSAAKAGQDPRCGYPNSGLDHGAIQLGDEFLKEAVAVIQGSPAWQEDSIIVIVWDEDDYLGYGGTHTSPKGNAGVTLGGANAPAIVIRSQGARHISVDRPLNHYSTLGTIQRVWGLGCLANTCGLKDADLMLDLFGRE